MEAVAIISGPTVLNSDERRILQIIFQQGEGAYAEFVDSQGTVALRIDGLLLGYEGYSPEMAKNALRLMGIPNNMFEALQKAAFCRETIRYRIVLEQVLGPRGGLLGALERFVTGNERTLRWKWRREY